MSQTETRSNSPSPGAAPGLIRYLALALTAAAILGGAFWFVRSVLQASPGPLSARTGDGAVRGGVRSHAELEARCAACHPEGADAETKSVSTLCLECHDEIRLQRRDPTGLHSRLGDVADCMRCHSEHIGAHAEITHVDPRSFPHDAVGFALASHEKTRDGRAFECQDCHATTLTRFDATGCVECHRRDAPDLMRAHEAAFGDRCLACHDGVDRFARGAFDHTKTGFALEGRHVQTGCEFCHRDVRDAAGFARAEPACATCHEAPASHATEGYGTTCGECHGTADWTATDLKNHRFPLDHGAASPSPCKTCHPVSNRAYTCYGCHEHTEARMLRKHRGEAGIRTAAELSACARCHPTGREHDTEDEGREGGEGRGRRSGDHDDDEDHRHGE
ncbi:hypothetical protein L6V77_28705 [Myxococcota bacterium]|nr:hypothetical protein [Myxococcota bacterium]